MTTLTEKTLQKEDEIAFRVTGILSLNITINGDALLNRIIVNHPVPTKTPACRQAGRDTPR